MKKIIGIVMVLLMLMSVTVALADVNKDTQPDKTYGGLQIFEKELSTTVGDEYVPDEFIVKFKPEVGKKKIDKINLGHGTSIKRAGSHFMRLNVPKGKTVAQMVKAYSRNPNVEYAEPNYIAHASMVPNDPFYNPYQWHLDNNVYGGINVEDAWDISTGTGVIVAVIDTGVAYENYDGYIIAPDLANTCFVGGYDFVNNDAHPNDDNSHGTHVAGTVAQSTNNNIGVAGVAFNAKIMPIKVLNQDGSGTYADVAAGIRWAADNDAKVISMSLGGRSSSTTLEEAVAHAYSKGVTIVAAAGNTRYYIAYPAAYDDYVIAVGATRYDETRASYSGTGNSLDIMAPGGDTSVDQNGDGYADGVLQNTFDPNTKNVTDFSYWFFQGTSMATPHVAGVAAMIIARGVSNPDDVRAILQSTAEDKGTASWDRYYGWGIVDAYAALLAAGPSNNPPTADDQSVTTSEDAPVTSTLTGSDLDDDVITFGVVTNPSNGALDLDPDFANNGNLTYIPESDFNGADSFTFKVNDGKSDSEPATVFITVNSVNDAPVADPQSVTTIEDIQVAITLTGSDVDGDPLTFNQPTNPNNGALDLDLNYTTNGKLTYTPNSGFNGSDSFTFTVNDGTVDSDPVTVSITVTKVNHPPVASSQNVTTEEDTPVAITLIASDPDGDSLTYSVVAGPSHGSLTGAAPDLTYAPELNFNGLDSFTFKANDGTADSNVATVNITVSPVNDAPVADDQSVTTNQDTSVGIILTASDVDCDSLTYAIVNNPSHGSLSGTAPGVTYTPETDYTGTDCFTFKANDGTADSNVATVNITVSPATSTTMHIANIDMNLVSRWRGWSYYATATVTIVDASNDTVEGATVDGHWEDATIDSDSGITDINGQVTLQSDSRWKPPSGTAFTFVVDTVEKTDWTYDPTANVETSDSITV
jgi:serine protease